MRSVTWVDSMWQREFWHTKEPAMDGKDKLDKNQH